VNKLKHQESENIYDLQKSDPPKLRNNISPLLYEHAKCDLAKNNNSKNNKHPEIQNVKYFNKLK